MNNRRHASQPCAVFVANRAFALTNSRLLLMQHFLSLGWQVVAATARDNYAAALSDLGVVVESVPFYRGKLAPGHDWIAFRALLRIYQQYQPALIHHFHSKPLVLGNAAAQWVRGAKTVNTVTGLGYAFVEGGVMRHLAAVGYRLFLRGSDATIFQNYGDQQIFVRKKWVPASKTHMIVSSGVDTRRFHPPSHFDAQSPPRVLMAGRLLWQKGVREFVEAARLVKQHFPSVRFQLAGEWDRLHPDAVPEAWVQAAVAEGVIEFLGYVTRMEAELPSTYLFVSPSYYGEGVPRVLLEASACGVPVVSCDVPGCREAIRDNVTGRLVAARDIHGLAEAISDILRAPTWRHQMGQAGRRYIEGHFDIVAITAKQLAVYRNLGLAV